MKVEINNATTQDLKIRCLYKSKQQPETHQEQHYATSTIKFSNCFDARYCYGVSNPY